MRIQKWQNKYEYDNLQYARKEEKKTIARIDQTVTSCFVQWIVLESAHLVPVSGGHSLIAHDIGEHHRRFLMLNQNQAADHGEIL